MDRTLFETRFRLASKCTWECSQRYLQESLPEKMLFHLYLNSSCDHHASDVFKRFPEDSSRKLHLTRLSEQEVVDELWREGLVPQWVDLTVVGKTRSSSIIEVRACGRFTSDEDCLYHQQGGLAPFHATGPALPVTYVQGERFSIFSRAECWNIDDLSHVLDHSAEVWSLDIHGQDFHHTSLDSLPLSFPSVEIIELRQTRFDGRSLHWLRKCPRLRILRILTGGASSLDLTDFPELPQLESLTIAGVQERLLGLHAALVSCSGLQEFWGDLQGEWHEDAELDLTRLKTLSLTAPSPPNWLRFSRSSVLETLHLHCAVASTEKICGVLHNVAHSLESVTLRGTPVTDEIFSTLSKMPRLQFVDLVDTKVCNTALLSFVRDRPALRYFPRRETA